MIIKRQKEYAELKDVGWDQSKLKDIEDRQERARKIRKERARKKPQEKLAELLKEEAGQS